MENLRIVNNYILNLAHNNTVNLLYKELIGGFIMKFKKIAALSLFFCISTSAVVHAATIFPTDEKAKTSEKNIECKHKHHEGKRHSGIFQAAKQMGISENDLKDAKKNGKSFFELAKKKGYSEQQARDFIIKTKTEAISKAVSEGKLTKEKGDEIVKNTKEKISKWDGVFKPHKEHKN